jgi:L-fucose mutarotase/ribose pyranase (RbsD/FucU family)
LKKIWRLGFIMLMIITATGCGTVVKDSSSNSNTKTSKIEGSDTENPDTENPDTENTDTENPDIKNLDIKNTDTEKSDIAKIDSEYTDTNNSDSQSSTRLATNSSDENYMPIPNANANVGWECGIYYSDISMENMEAYLKSLALSGWKDIQGNDSSTHVVEGTSEYSLTKGNRLLQIMMNLKDKEVSICNSILVYLEENVSVSDIKKQKAAMSKEEALVKIQANVDESIEHHEIPYTKRVITGLFEIHMEDAYDKLQMQAFAANSDNGFTGCFVIRKGVVSYLKGSLSNACIADIDKDGKYELLNLASTWEGGLFKIGLIAYEYVNPTYFNSCTEILLPKYSNCFVPDHGYEELQLTKVDDTTVMLSGGTIEYGTIKVRGGKLIIDSLEKFPFTEWATSYDQNQLLTIEKEIPDIPPEIILSIDGLGLDYVVCPTKWDSKENQFTTADALAEIMDKASFLPTFGLAGINIVNTNRSVLINFGSSIPDSIKVFDAMLDEQGNVRYGEKLIMERAVKIIDNSQVSLDLTQHMALALSSYLGDYEKDWRRLFRVVCSWGEKECVYAFLINTGRTEVLTKITDNQFLKCEGSFSQLSSSWGLGISIDSKYLPKHYFIEWQVSNGSLRKWGPGTKPSVITDQHNGYPMTFSEDSNSGAVIWAPLSFDIEEDVVVKAYIYEEETDRSPVAYSKIILNNEAGVFYKNNVTGSLPKEIHSSYTKKYIWSVF